jgi:O-antigen ligase
MGLSVNPITDNRRRNSPSAWELSFICFLVLIIPTLEALKHLVLFLYMIAWFWRCSRNNDFGGKLDLIEYLVIAIICLSVFITPLFGPRSASSSLLENMDLIRMLLLFLLVRRTKFEDAQFVLIFIFAFAGVFIGLIHGWYVFYIQGIGSYPTLKSVGHVNHAAIYISLILCWSLIIYFTNESRKIAVLGLVVFIFLNFSLLPTLSRTSIGASFFTVFAICLFVYSRYRIRKPLLILGLLVVFAISSIGLNLPVVKEQVAFQNEPKGMIYDRIMLWNSASAVYKENLFFGTGAGSYRWATSPDRVQSVLTARSENFDPKLHSNLSHAHNLGINWLVERGLVSLLCIVTLFIVLVHGSLSRLTGKSVKTSVSFQQTATVLSTLILTAITSLANTTLHHEHGLLTMVMVGFLAKCTESKYQNGLTSFPPR